MKTEVSEGNSEAGLTMKNATISELETSLRARSASVSYRRENPHEKCGAFQAR
jgi:hypothetical protein